MVMGFFRARENLTKTQLHPTPQARYVFPSLGTIIRHVLYAFHFFFSYGWQGCDPMTCILGYVPAGLVPMASIQ